jgi:hypothetical protein
MGVGPTTAHHVLFAVDRERIQHGNAVYPVGYY